MDIECSTEYIKEGLAKIYTNNEAITFYNPIQEFNRDLTIILLKTFTKIREEQKNQQMEIDNPTNKIKLKIQQNSEGIKILDALSASGLRAIRFALEIENIELIIANDFSEQAVKTIKRNLELNGLNELKIKINCSDAIDLMIEHRKFSKRFHAIDLDPYGSPSIFLDSAVQAVIDGGILMVTSTDTAVLCGNTPEACFNKYGSIPIKHKACHEIALRILLRSIDSHANRYGRYIIPLLSVSIDFYVRCFVRIESSASIAKESVTKLANIFSCSNCQCWSFQPLIRKTLNNSSNIRFCPVHLKFNSLINYKENKEIKEPCCSFCGSTAIHFGGPIYIAPIHDYIFVKKMLESLKKENSFQYVGTIKRLVGVLTLVLEELEDQPLFYEFEQLMRIIKCSATPKNIIVRSALLNAGFKCSGSHCGPQALKTNAPTEFLWDICREWAKKSNKNPNGIQKLNPVGLMLMNTKSTFPVDFTLNKEAIPASKIENILRFQDNKGKNWGPKAKAKGSINSAKAGFGEI
ncbi:hypothetical protein ACQ4LE_007262 [Meloidogyne hapla]